MGFFNRTRFLPEKSTDSYSTASDATTPAPTIIPGKDADFGTASIIKTFYQKTNNGSFDWVDSPPKQLAKKVAKANDRVAIKIYKIFDNDQPTISGKTPLKVNVSLILFKIYIYL